MSDATQFGVNGEKVLEVFKTADGDYQFATGQCPRCFRECLAHVALKYARELEDPRKFSKQLGATLTVAADFF